MILNLTSITVIRTEENDGDYHVYAVPTAEPKCCQSCRKTDFYGHGTKTSLFFDTPIHGKRVGILLERKRYKCRTCGVTTMQPCRDISEKHRATNRLVEYIEKLSMSQTFTSVASDIGVTEGTVRNIMKAYAESLSKRYVFETPEILGIDEAHLNKTMRLVLTNIEEKTIIDIVESREKKAVIAALERIKDKSKVKYVTMDMWRPYRDAVALSLPKAKVVIDKVHVVKMANSAADTARMAIKSELPADQYKLLKRDKYLIRTRRRDLTLQQSLILKGWLINHPKLYESYEAKERFFEIFDNTEYNSGEAYEAYLVWLDSIPSEIKVYFSDIERALRNWQEEVFAYFDKRITNAYTESANNLIKHIYKQGRGYSFPVLRTRVLFNSKLHKTKPFKSKIADGAIGFSLGIMQPEFEIYGVQIPHEHEVE